MIFNTITFEQKDLVECVRREYNNQLFAYAFCTLFLWKDILKLSIYTESDFFVVKSNYSSDNTYFFPCGNEDKIRQFISLHMHEQDFTLRYISEQNAAFLQENFKDVFELTSDRDSWEYIFSKKEHLELAGKKYARIRSERNHLRNTCNLYCQVINSFNIADALAVIESWKANRQKRFDEEFDDYQIALLAVNSMQELGLSGCIVYVDSLPSAVVIGNEISSDTFGIQIAKTARPLAGLQYYALHSFFQMLPDHYLYVNGDDDMGIEGIRKHKLKMQPYDMNRIWKGTMKP